ncbi:MAG: HD domain-containing protein [Chloroflexi bacterium]|nr:HD domain-containing protein [Chloroflexota bacterium]
MDINKDEIARLTEEYCGVWGINHTRRLLQLISEIGQGMTYNPEPLWLAAHLHDWGAYSPWAQKDVDHALRSSQVAGPFLRERGYPEEATALVTEIIALHHTGGSDRSLEAILLRDADTLDFLGVVGILRDFSKNPKDMRKAYDTTKGRRNKLPGLLVLPAAQAMAAERVKEMDIFLAQFEVESFGCF